MFNEGSCEHNPGLEKEPRQDRGRRRRCLNDTRNGACLAAPVLAALGLQLAGATLGAGSAHAQLAGNFTLERFRIAVDRDGVLDVEWGGTLRRGHWDLGLWLGASDDPLVVVQDAGGERIGSLVEHRVGGHLVATMGIVDFLQAGLELPVIVSQDGSGMSPVGMTGDLSRAGLGDVRLIPKLRLLEAARHGVDLSIIPAITLPTSTSDDGNDYFGQAGAGFAPELAVSRAFGAVRVAGNVGYRTRKLARAGDLEVDDEIFAHAGAGYRFGQGGGLPLEVALTLAAATRADDLLGDSNNDYVELHGGVQYALARPLLGFVAGGVGLSDGFGAPDWRVLLGARFGIGEVEPARVAVDTDGDGLADDRDECPTEPETRNGFEDDDGCPDQVDSDGDGLIDGEDACPRQPEDVDGFEDEDGCPDPDNDGDTVLDSHDECPGESGPPANRGCPDPDRDGDSVVDRLDNCPDQAGDPANHGCKRPQLVAIKEGKLELVDPVYFRVNRDVIQPRSFALLDNVAAVLQAHPGVRVRIAGHTDDRGDDGHNKDLSRRRAGAVMRYLVRKGVDAGRLEAVGHGEEQPLQSNDTDEGRAVNRRVDFHIIGAEGAAEDVTGD